MSYADQDAAADFETRRPAKRSSGCLWGSIVGGVLAVGLCVVGCCGGLVYFGLNITTTQIETALRDNPKLREHLGEVQSFKMNLTRSAAVDGGDTWVYDVVGAKASGELTVQHVTGDDGDENILSASLRLKDGTVVDLLEEAAVVEPQ